MRKILILLLLLVLVMSLTSCFKGKGVAAGKPKAARIETISDFKIIGLAKKGNMQTLNYEQVWNDFMKRANEVADADKDLMYGVTLFDPNMQMTPDAQFTFMAAVSVKSAANVPEGMIFHTVKGGDFAVFEHHGKIEEVGMTYMYIFGEWLPKSGYTYASNDSFEKYDKRFKHDSADSVMEIWVPVSKIK